MSEFPSTHVETNRVALRKENKEGAKKKILVAEDQEDVLELTVKRLERSGYEVFTASNGQELLDMLNSGEFDAVITDIDMPIMDGLTAVEKIRENPKFENLHIIIHSGEWGKEGRKERANVLKDVKRLEKPYTIKDLEGHLGEFFEKTN